MYNYNTNKKIYEKFNKNNIENIVSYKPQVKDYILLNLLYLVLDVDNMVKRLVGLKGIG